MLHDDLTLLGLLLFVAAVVAMLTQRFKLPYSVGLMLAGVVLAFVPLPFTLPLSRDLIFDVLLPPIVFEAALNIHWHDLRRNFPVVGLLSSVGVVIAAAVATAGMHFLAGWNWTIAALFGTLIAATDPVSVIATFKRVNIDPRLHLLVESESLFNDGTAAVAFAVVLAVAGGRSSGIGSIGGSLVWMILGGVACGASIALLLLLLARRTADSVVELTLTTLIAYGSFLIADRLAMSGVLATLTAGLIVGNSKELGSSTERGRVSVYAYWAYLAFLADSLIFLLLGAQTARQPFLDVLWPAAVAVVVVLAGRAIAIYPLSMSFWRSKLKVDIRHQHILVWGGLRGALALGLALGLPQDLPGRATVITVAFAVVAFSIFVQGLTMTPLLRHLGLIRAE